MTTFEAASAGLESIDKNIDAIIAERDELRCQRDRLLEACKSARGMTGHGHWDHTRQRGGGCELCIRQREIMAGIEAAIAVATPTA